MASVFAIDQRRLRYERLKRRYAGGVGTRTGTCLRTGTTAAPIVGIRRRTGLAPGHDTFDLLGIERLIPHQGVRHRVKPIQIVGEQLASTFVVPLLYGPHLLVDLARGLNGGM